MSDISVNSLKNVANSGTDNIILLSNGDVKFANPNLPNNPITLNNLGRFEEILPKATDNDLGLVKIGLNLSIDNEGVISSHDTTYDVATISTPGLLSSEDKLKLDSLEPQTEYSLPIANENLLGGIKVGNNLSIDGDGVLSASNKNIALQSPIINIHGPDEESSIQVNRLPEEKALTYSAYVNSSNNQYKINPNSIYFNGPLNDTVGFISIPDHEDFHIKDNLTIELWVYMDNNQPLITGLIGQIDEANNLYNILQLLAGKFLQWKTSSGNVESLTPLPNDQWNHVALVKYNDYGYIYLNGTRIAESTFNGELSNIGTPLLIGKTIIDGAGQPFNGFLDEIRISKTTRYLTNFTPIEDKFVSDDNTILLIHGGDLTDDIVKSYQTTIVDGPIIANYDLSQFYSQNEIDNLLALKSNASDVYNKSELDTSVEVDAKILNLKSEILGGAGPAYDTLQEIVNLMDSTGNTSSESLMVIINDKANISDIYYRTAIDEKLDLKADQNITYTKSEIDNTISLIEAQLNHKAFSINVYDINEVNNLLSSKADSTSVYTKTEVNNLVNPKADSTSVYTKTEVNNLVNPKANVGDVYTKIEVDARLYHKADVTYIDNFLNAKANVADVYTKSELDTALDLKYNKDEVNNLLALKADSDVTYSKIEVDNFISQKVNSSEVYTKLEIDTALDLKYNKDELYNKTEIISLLYDKSDRATTYNKTEVNNFLLLKANYNDVYTKTQVDSLVGSSTLLDLEDTVLTSITDGQVLSYDSSTSKWVNIDIPSSDLSGYYTKGEVDSALNLKANQSIVYTKAEANSLIDEKADQSTTYVKSEVDGALNLKANSTDVYTKFEVDTSSEVDSKLVSLKNEILGGADNAHDTLEELRVLIEAAEESALITSITDSLNSKADQSTTYTKTEVDTAISNVSVDLSSYDTSAEVDTKIEAIPVTKLDNVTAVSDFPSLLDSFELSTLDSCKYIIKIKSDSGNRYIAELLLLHDGTDCFITEYGIIDTASTSWVTLSCNIVDSNVELSLTTSVNGTGNSTVEITKLI